MAVYNITTPNTNAYVRSADTTSSYTKARAGTGTFAPAATVNGSYVWIGQNTGGTEYDVLEGFTRWVTTSIPSTQQVVSATIKPTIFNAVTGTQWNLEMRDYNWNGATSVTGSTFVPGASISNFTLLAQIVNMATGSTAYATNYMGSDQLISRVSRLGMWSGASTTISTLWNSSRTQAGTTPTSIEKTIQLGSVASGYPATLSALAIPISTHNYVGGASIQLSDGTHVWVDTDGNPTPAQLTLNYQAPRGGSSGTIATFTVSETSSTNIGLYPAYQAVALCRDSSDNLYVIGRSGGSTNNIVVKTFAKGSGYAWTQKTARTASLPAYANGSVNNFSAAWHPTSGSGHIMLAFAHRPGDGQAGQFGYAVLSCSVLLAGSGTVITTSGSNPSWMGFASVTGYNRYLNETGSGLDIATDGSNKGVIFTYQADNTAAAGGYTLSSTGTISSSVAFPAFQNYANRSKVTFTKDAQSKLRAIPIDSGRVALIGKGTISIRNWSGTELGSGDIWNQVLASLSAFDTAYDGITSWDAVYDRASNKIWFYYLDLNNQQRLLRTGFSLATYQVTGEETVVNAAVAASGTNTSIRIARGKVNEREVRVGVANINGSTYTTVVTNDSLNLAPNPPTLATVNQFNATTAQTFSWTFNDANTDDSQTSYQLQIQRVSDGVVVYDTSKVTSTTQSATVPANSLVNATGYQWRVSTWDVANVQGSWSPYSTFSTSSAATVTITSPATDGTTLDTSYVTLTWTVSGATQAQFRPEIWNLTTGVYTDGGWRSSTAQTVTWNRLPSGMDWKAAITIKDGTGVQSNSGFRTFSTLYESPQAPTFTLTPGDTYVQVDIVNPAPTGDQPEVDHNDVWRKRTSDDAGAYVRIGSTTYNGTYVDYAVESGISYDYYVEGVS